SDAEASEKIQENGLLQVFPGLLAPHSSCTPKVANIIAEVAKNDAEASEKIKENGLLQVFPGLLDPHSSCTPKVANIIAEVAKNESMRSACVEAGLIPPLVQLLNCKDQEVLLQTGRALGNICYDSHSLQAQLINMGVIPTLVKLLGVHFQNTPLTEMCLIAFGNLAELESSKEQFASTNIAEELVKLFRKQTEHEKKEMIFEVLAPLAENDMIKLQLVDAGLVECLLDVVGHTVDGDKEEDLAELKTASDLMVLLLLGDESMQKLFDEGKGSVFQRVLSWVPSHNHQLQLAGALAIANFARNDGNCIHMVDTGIVQKLLDLLDRHVEDGNVTVQHAALSALRNLAIPVVNKAKMLSAGVSEEVLKFLKSEMPPVQFKLLGTLRMLIDAQGMAEKDLESATLVQVLHKLLSDERSAPEIKYNSMILICTVMGSEPLHKEVQGLMFLDVVSKLRSHENKTVAQQASLTEQRLTVQS
ncbi:UNVERIFIED_CONTAM: hypothetical protein FKN15_029396, partial [Acipenser sinensis]